MNWTLIKPAEAVKKTTVSLRLLVPQKRGKPTLQISVPTTIAPRYGFDAEGVESANVYMGDGPLAGKMWVEPAKEGASKLKRLAHTIVITVPAPAGLVLSEQQDAIEPVPEPENNGFFLDLPGWALPGGDGTVAPSKLAGEKPAALELNGTTLICGSREARLTKQQAVVMEKLNERFGKMVTKQALHDALYADDPNGGANEKIIDVHICKIRDQIKGWPITIQTHFGKGYELRRAVT